MSAPTLVEILRDKHAAFAAATDDGLREAHRWYTACVPPDPPLRKAYATARDLIAAEIQRREEKEQP